MITRVLAAIFGQQRINNALLLSHIDIDYHYQVIIIMNVIIIYYNLL